jgi:phage shock protein E
MFKSIRTSCFLPVILILLSLSLLAGGCDFITGKDTCDTPYDEQQIFDITVPKANDLIRENTGNPEFIILDVRTPEEFANGHIEGAINIDINDNFVSEAATLEKDKTYLVYCHSGRRSAEARDTMAQLGFKNIYNMTAGISEWQSAGFPVVR